MAVTFPPPDSEELHPLLDGRMRPPLRMTEAEFESWVGSDTPAEWVDGEVVLMSPTSLVHNRLTVWFVHLLSEYRVRRPVGEVLGPEFTVRLPAQRRRRVPDVLFVARERASLLKPLYLEGAPDLAIEIVSADSQSRDRREKFVEYEKAGVREYWIVDPLSQTVEAYMLHAGAFVLISEVGGFIASTVLPDFRLKPDWLWQEPLPAVSGVLREMGFQA